VRALCSEAPHVPHFPYAIGLSEAERAVQEQSSRCYAAPHREVVGADIVFLAADDRANVCIALELGTYADVVSESRSVVAESVNRAWPTGAGRDGPVPSGQPGWVRHRR